MIRYFILYMTKFNEKIREDKTEEYKVFCFTFLYLIFWLN